jgi:hypothetical protein
VAGEKGLDPPACSPSVKGISRPVGLALAPPVDISANQTEKCKTEKWFLSVDISANQTEICKTEKWFLYFSVLHISVWWPKR